MFSLESVDICSKTYFPIVDTDYGAILWIKLGPPSMKKHPSSGISLQIKSLQKFTHRIEPLTSIWHYLAFKTFHSFPWHYVYQNRDPSICNTLFFSGKKWNHVVSLGTMLMLSKWLWFFRFLHKILVRFHATTAKIFEGSPGSSHGENEKLLFVSNTINILFLQILSSFRFPKILHAVTS